MRGFYEKFMNENDKNLGVEIYVDGSFSQYKKAGTFGCFINDNLKLNGGVIFETVNNVTCEMYAVIEGIKLAIKHNHKAVNIYTDSEQCMLIAASWKCNARYRNWFEQELQKLEELCKITVIKTSRNSSGLQYAHNLCQEAYA